MKSKLNQQAPSRRKFSELLVDLYAVRPPSLRPQRKSRDKVVRKSKAESSPGDNSGKGFTSVMRKIPTSIKNAELLNSRRSEIAYVAYKLFSRKGFVNTSVEEVARALGFDKRSLYNYVEKKEDLLYLVFYHFLKEVTKTILEKVNGIRDPLEKLKLAIRTDLQWTSHFQNFAMLVSRELRYLDKESIQSTLELISENFQITEQILKEGIAKGVFKPFNPTILSFLLKAQIHMIATYRWGLKGFSLEEIGDHIIDIFFPGLVKSPKAKQ